MSKTVNIGNFQIGEGEPCFSIAEIGINHNGDIEIAQKLIAAAQTSGCSAVKFQKRTVDVVYTPEELARPRKNPFGETNGDLKRGLEFDSDQYKIIDESCKKNNILWFASCWDEGAVDFMEQFNPPCFKISSASLTDDDLLRYHRKFNRPIILSTGMSTIEQLDHALDVLGTDDLIILHCTSTYPAELEELNLKAIPMLKKRYDVPIGYSGHEVGLSTTVAASVLGACIVERHITMNRAMWGSDQSASVEPQGFLRIMSDIRSNEEAMGDGHKKVYASEVPIMKKLRKNVCVSEY